MKTAFRIGLKPNDFWDLTPNELKLCVEATNDRVMAERERDLWVSWHTAFLHRVEVKYFPKLSELMAKLRPGADSDDAKPDTKAVSRDLMNALLQLPAKPPTKDAADAFPQEPPPSPLSPPEQEASPNGD